MQDIVSLLVLWLLDAGLEIDKNPIAGVKLEASPVPAIIRKMWNAFIAA